jgi:hypothetical protein
MLERLPTPRLSEAGITVMHQLSVSGERPTVLLRAFEAGAIPYGDLPALVAFAWTRATTRRHLASARRSGSRYERAGFFTYPPVGTGRPSASVTVYRGATAERAARMSWAVERNMAVQLGACHTWYGRTWLYEATVRPDAVLAYLERRGEGWTVVVNPAGLSQIERREELRPR